MNRLANALAFAAVVLGMFALEARQRWPQYTPSQLVACAARRLHVVPTARSNDLPAVASFEDLPQIEDVQIEQMAEQTAQIDQARLQRTLQRAQAARQRLMRVEMRHVAERINAQVRRANCTVVKLDQ
jgi:hypothetical protein